MSACPSSFCTVIEQMRGKCVAQGMRRERPVGAHLGRVAFEQIPEGLARHPLATRGDKHRVGGAMMQQFGSRTRQIALKPGNGLLTERHEALLRALAHYAQHARIKAELTHA